MKGQRRIMQAVSLRDKQKEIIKNNKHRNIESRGNYKGGTYTTSLLPAIPLPMGLNKISLEQKDTSL